MLTHHTKVKALVTALALAGTAISSRAHAEDAAPTPWSTTSHFGFAVVDHSSTAFDRSSGSLMFLDVERDLTAKIAVGARTLAQGAKLGGRAFYRLGAGPLLSFRVIDGWVLQLAATRFDETGVGAADETQYRSKGSATQFGWERTYRYGQKVELAWGGFIVAHQGDIQAEPAATSQRAFTSQHNSGLGHGIEAALRVDL